MLSDHCPFHKWKTSCCIWIYNRYILKRLKTKITYQKKNYDIHIEIFKIEYILKIIENTYQYK